MKCLEVDADEEQGDKICIVQVKDFFLSYFFFYWLHASKCFFRGHYHAHLCIEREQYGGCLNLKFDISNGKYPHHL